MAGMAKFDEKGSNDKGGEAFRKSLLKRKQNLPKAK